MQCTNTTLSELSANAELIHLVAGSKNDEISVSSLSSMSTLKYCEWWWPSSLDSHLFGAARLEAFKMWVILNCDIMLSLRAAVMSPKYKRAGKISLHRISNLLRSAIGPENTVFSWTLNTSVDCACASTASLYKYQSWEVKRGWDSSPPRGWNFKVKIFERICHNSGQM